MKTAMTLDGKIGNSPRENRNGFQGKHLVKTYIDYATNTQGLWLASTPLFMTMHALPPYGARKNPVRIVVDSCLRIAPYLQCLKDQENNQTILATTNQASPLAARKLETFGSKVLYCSSKDNRVDLNDLMNQLGAMGVDSILLEGGATLK